MKMKNLKNSPSMKGWTPPLAEDGVVQKPAMSDAEPNKGQNTPSPAVAGATPLQEGNLKIKNFTIVILIALSLFFETTAFADTWARTYNKGYQWSESGRYIWQTSDGGFAVAASPQNYNTGEPGFWLLKLDISGDIEWEKFYPGGSKGVADFLTSADKTSDGGFVLAGHNNYGIWYDDFVVLKTDSLGNVQWAKVYSNAESDIPYSVKQTSDGGFIVGGSTDSDIWILKLDSLGNIEWQKTYDGGGDYDKYAHYDWMYYGKGIKQTSDGGFIVTGATRGAGIGGADVWLLKLDASGNILWQKAYGGDDFDMLFNIEITADGGFILAGSTYSFSGGGGRSYMWILKLDSWGNIQWQKEFIEGKHSSVTDIKQTPDGNFIAVGGIDFDGFPLAEALVLKLDPNGNVLWAKTYGDIRYEYALSVVLTTDGGMVVSGGADTPIVPWEDAHDIWILKLDRDGNIAPGCPYVKETPATAVDTSAIVTAINGSAQEAFGWAYSVSNPGVDTFATVREQCRYLCPPTTGCKPKYSSFYTDMNCDGCVDELIEFSYSFGSKCGDDWHNPDTNFNYPADDMVDGQDLSIFINDFGAGCF